MLILLTLWGGYYPQDDFDRRRSSTSYEDFDVDDDYTPKRKNISSDRGRSNYAQGTIPKKIQDVVNSDFKLNHVKHILGYPSTEDDILEWNMSDHDDKKDRLITNTRDKVCTLMRANFEGECGGHRSLIERIVSGTFDNVKIAVLNDLLKTIDETSRIQTKRLATVRKKIQKIKAQAPQQKRNVLKMKKQIRDQERRLDQEIAALTRKKSKDQYDEQTIESLNEEKLLLLEDPAHIDKDLRKEAKVVEKMKEQSHKLQEDIERLKITAKKVYKAISDSEESLDLSMAWDELNNIWSEHEAAVRSKKESDAKEKQELREQEAKKNKEEEDATKSELGMFESLNKQFGLKEEGAPPANPLAKESNTFEKILKTAAPIFG